MVFVASLFFIKNTSFFKNQGNYIGGQDGLAYDNEIIADLVNRDLDQDGVLDWEEGLWGTDPTKKDTNDDGVPDNVDIEKQKTARGQSVEVSGSAQEPENLTETDQFSREFFATVATLNQNGVMDQATADQLGSSLAEKIKNAPQRKVFFLSDLKTTADNTQTVQSYSESLINISTKYSIDYTVYDVLQKFIIDENNVDVTVLSELDPLIEHANKIITDISKMSVPQSLAPLHLEFLNVLQRLSENVSDMKLYDADAIVALSAISQYEQNTIALDGAISNLENTIRQKLNN